MEHSPEKIIQEKIRAAEMHPVQWNRDRVWQNLATTQTAEPVRTVFYYAAAAAVLIGCIVAYVIEQNYKTGLQEKISALEAKVNKPPLILQLNEINDSSNAFVACVEEPINSKKITSSKSPEQKRFFSKPGQDRTEVTSVEAFVTLSDEISQASPSREETAIAIVVPNEPVSTKKTVNAIVGVIPVYSNRTITTRRSTRTCTNLHFLKPVKDADTEIEESKSLSARIN